MLLRRRRAPSDRFKQTCFLLRLACKVTSHVCVSHLLCAMRTNVVSFHLAWLCAIQSKKPQSCSSLRGLAMFYHELQQWLYLLQPDMDGVGRQSVTQFLKLHTIQVFRKYV